MKKLTKLQQRKVKGYVRGAIQLLYFVFFPSAFTTAFSGVKYLFTQLGRGGQIECVSFLKALLLICAYTIVFGRFFCGNACAFGSFSDLIHKVASEIAKKSKKKIPKIPARVQEFLIYIKYFILLAIVSACFLGIYEKSHGYSPWEVFSKIRVLNFVFSGYGLGILLLIIMCIGAIFCERFFCRFFCPMGAVFSLLPVLPFFSINRDKEACLKGCKGCATICPSGLDIPQTGSLEVCGDCFVCGKCIDICPKGNTGHRLKMNYPGEIIFSIIRAAVLVLLLIIAGV